MLRCGVDHAHAAAQLPRGRPQRVGHGGGRRARRHPAVGLGGRHRALARGRREAARARRPRRAADAGGARVRRLRGRRHRAARAGPPRRPRGRGRGGARRCASPRSRPRPSRSCRRLMRAFRRARPHIGLRLEVGNRDHVLAMVLGHDADVAVGGNPPRDGRIEAHAIRPNRARADRRRRRSARRPRAGRAPRPSAGAPGSCASRARARARQRGVPGRRAASRPRR